MMMVIIFQMASTDLMLWESLPPLVISTMAFQVTYSTSFPSLNAAWTSFATLFHQVFFGRSSSLASARHNFSCSIHIPDAPPDQFYWSHLTSYSSSFSYVTVFSVSKGSTITRMFYSGEGTFRYRLTYSITILYVVTFSSGRDMFLKSLLHTFILSHTSCTIGRSDVRN